MDGLKGEHVLMISLYLRPRDWLKFAQVGRRIKESIDNDVYWSRVAAHIVFRDYAAIDTRGNLYALRNLQCTYKEAIDRIIELGKRLWTSEFMRNRTKWTEEQGLVALVKEADIYMGPSHYHRMVVEDNYMKDIVIRAVEELPNDQVSVMLRQKSRELDENKEYDAAAKCFFARYFREILLKVSVVRPTVSAKNARQKMICMLEDYMDYA